MHYWPSCIILKSGGASNVEKSFFKNAKAKFRGAQDFGSKGANGTHDSEHDW